MQVFKCGDSGKPFVSHLEGYTNDIKAKMEAATKADPSKPEPPMDYMMYADHMLVKRPGDKKWIEMTPPQTMNKYRRSGATPVCPDGTSNNIIPLNPNEP